MSDIQMQHGYVYLVNRKNSRSPFPIYPTFALSKQKSKAQFFHINEVLALNHKECFAKASVVRATIVIGEIVAEDED